MYGGGSIKRTGVYDRIVASLKEAGVAVSEFRGVEPNPQYTTVNRAMTETAGIWLPRR